MSTNYLWFAASSPPKSACRALQTQASRKETEAVPAVNQGTLCQGKHRSDSCTLNTATVPKSIVGRWLFRTPDRAGVAGETRQAPAQFQLGDAHAFRAVARQASKQLPSGDVHSKCAAGAGRRRQGKCLDNSRKETSWRRRQGKRQNRCQKETSIPKKDEAEETSQA